MNREQGVRGVQMATGGYIRLKILRTVFAFGAWSSIRFSPWVNSALLGNVENRWTVCESAGKVLDFLGFRGVVSRICRSAEWFQAVRRFGLGSDQFQMFVALPTLRTGPPNGPMVSHMAKKVSQIEMKGVWVDRYGFILRKSEEGLLI